MSPLTQGHSYQQIERRSAQIKPRCLALPTASARVGASELRMEGLQREFTESSAEFETGDRELGRLRPTVDAL